MKNCKYESLDGHVKEETIVGFICWELKSHLLKALVLPTCTYDTKIWENDLKNSSCFWEGHEDAYDVLMSKYILPQSIILCWLNFKNSHRIMCCETHHGFSTTACSPAFLLISQSSTSFSWDLDVQGFNTWHVLTTMWKKSSGLLTGQKVETTWEQL